MMTLWRGLKILVAELVWWWLFFSNLSSKYCTYNIRHLRVLTKPNFQSEISGETIVCDSFLLYNFFVCAIFYFKKLELMNHAHAFSESCWFRGYENMSVPWKSDFNFCEILAVRGSLILRVSAAFENEKFDEKWKWLTPYIYFNCKLRLEIS